MKPGMMVVINDDIACYGKVPLSAFVNEDIDFLSALNRVLGRSFRRTLLKRIKAGDKFLKKHGYGPIEMLSSDEIEKIRLSQELPLGGLICQL